MKRNKKNLESNERIISQNILSSKNERIKNFIKKLQNKKKILKTAKKKKRK